MSYRFELYDVLQSRNGPAGREWLDFATLKDEEDARLAVGLVRAGRWEGKALQFRIVRHVLGVGYESVCDGPQSCHDAKATGEQS